MSNRESVQRYSRGRQCPVCQGSDNDRRGQGTRCHGFIAGEWAHCSREEHAGKARFHPESSTWSHRLKGECPCGQVHIPAPVEPHRKTSSSFLPRIEHIYKYRDIQGRVLFEVLRLKDPKDFRQRRPLGNGKFAWNLKGIEPVLYNLPALSTAPADQTIFVVEGEKDVDRLGTLGLLATTNPMGAGKWQAAYAEPLRGRRVVIIPDNDPPDLPAYPRGKGRDHAEAVARSLGGIAASIRILDLPGLPEKGDVSDWIDQRPENWLPEACAAELLRLADAAPTWQPLPVPVATDGNGKAHGNGNGKAKGNDNGSLDYRSLQDHELGLVAAKDVEPEEVEWLWKYTLARSEMAILAGEGGLGKSTFLLACAAAVSRGDFWPGGNARAPRGTVIIVSAEDSPGTTLRPRLQALDADLAKVVFCKARVILERDGEKMIHPVSLQNHGYWKAVFDRFPDTVLFIVDPIPSYLGRGVNDRQNNEIREVLEPFIEDVIRPRRICFYCNTHLSKNMDARTPVQRITGSIAYANIPRNVHIIVRDADQPGRRYFKQCKCNNGPDNLPAIAFTIRAATVSCKGREIETSTPEFEEGTHDIDLAAVMNGQKDRRGPRPVKSSAFAEWIWEKLQGGDAVLVMDLVTKAQDDELLPLPTNGERISPAPLYNAMRRIPELHPGWYVDQQTIEAGHGLYKRERKAWILKQGDAPGRPAIGPTADADGRVPF